MKALLHIYYCLQGEGAKKQCTGIEKAYKIWYFTVGSCILLLFCGLHKSTHFSLDVVTFFWMKFFMDVVAGMSSKHHQQLIDYHHEHTHPCLELFW